MTKLSSVICAACGGKVREDRVRCLRCGAPLVARPAEGTGSAAAERPWLAIIAMAGCVALGGFAVMIADGDSRPAPPAARRPAPAVAAEPAATETATTGGDGPFTDVQPASATAHAAREAAAPGVAAYNGGNVAAAMTAFREAVDADPDNPEALNNLAQALVRAGRPREALPFFDRAVAVQGGVWAYHFNRARAYGELQMWRQAVAGYRDAERLFPEDYVTQFNLARALQAFGDLPAAITAFERAIVLAPGQNDFHLSHGRALEAAGRRGDAAAAYRRYLALEPDGPEAEKIKGHVAKLEGA